jgi:hypothetical protein
LCHLRHSDDCCRAHPLLEDFQQSWFLALAEFVDGDTARQFYYVIFSRFLGVAEPQSTAKVNPATAGFERFNDNSVLSGSY